MKFLKIASKLFWINVGFFILYNFYFGWNKLPLSDLEATFDTISKWGFTIWFIVYLIPLMRLYESAVKKNDNV